MLRIEKEVSQSYLTQLWNQDFNQNQNKKGLNSLVEKVSQYFTIAIISVALITFTYWSFYDARMAILAFERFP